MSNDKHNHGQLTLSHELLALVQWLVEHDTEKIKKLISRAVSGGLKDKINRQKTDNNEQALEEAQNNIMDFFSLLEVLLAESLHENMVQRAVEQKLMPAVEQIDATQCDDATIRLSVEKATTQLNLKPQANPQEVLFQELLKRWKPNKKQAMH